MRRTSARMAVPSLRAATTIAFAAKRAPDRSSPLQLSALIQVLDTPERGDHLLADLHACTAAFDDLEIGATAGGLLAEVHGRLISSQHMITLNAK
jgi:hypothetical protein